MKTLVVGCGSIGRRHINNLLKLDKIENILVYTSIKDCPEKFYYSKDKIKFLEKLDEAEADFAIICNETSKHIKTATQLAKKGINLFIEKPLSHNLTGIEELKEIVSTKKIKLAIGYNLRFLGALEYLKGQLAEGILGELYFAKIESGQYLPDWRKNIDYRNSYSAFRDKGGGVDLDLSHEIDYMCYLFGYPQDWKVIKAKVSKLEIDSDDIFEGLYFYNNGFICNVHLDYLQVDKKREIRIIGSNGEMSCDLINGNIRASINNKESLICKNELFDIDKTYIDELNDFIASTEKNIVPRVTLSDGIRVLRLLEDKDVQR